MTRTSSHTKIGRERSWLSITTRLNGGMQMNLSVCSRRITTPFLKKQIEVGNALQVTAQSPINHSTEDGRWDYRVTIVWKNVQVAHDDSGDEQVLKHLYPDQETFKREEQRRFEILVAHWDVPIKSVDLDQK
jgi:nitric oxide reductase activation protein